MLLKEIKNVLIDKCHYLAFDNNLYSKLRKRKHAICLGDSHISVFRYINRENLLMGYTFDVVVVGGATAQGMLNPNSKTDALKIFKQRISKAKHFQTLFFQLGEVDCGFVIWYYAEKNSISIKEQLSRSIENYTNFILEIKGRGFSNICVLSAPLPTIEDGQDWGEVANVRREVKASQLMRTKLTQKYNQFLKVFCLRNNIMFLDVTSPLYDLNTGIIHDKFINKDITDHHLDDSKYSRIICGAIQEMDSSLCPSEPK